MLPITFLPWNGTDQIVDQRLSLQIRRSMESVRPVLCSPESQVSVLPGARHRCRGPVPCGQSVRKQGRPAAEGQLQQDVRLAARGRVDRHDRPAFPRSSSHQEPVRRPQRRRASGPDGPHGSRQRTGRDDPPEHEARGADQLITSAIDAHVQDEQRKDGEGPAEVLTLAG